MQKDFLIKQMEKKELSSIEEVANPITKKFLETDIKKQENLIEPVKETYGKKLPTLEEMGIKKPNRIATGIYGLDKLLEGGFVPSSVVLVSGEAGAGKTIFCTQFIWNALCLGENGVYVTLQQPPEEIKDDVILFGKDFEAAERNGQCRIISAEAHDLKKIVELILKSVKEVNAKRLAIDAITLVGEYTKDFRENLMYLVKELKKMGVTTLMASEIEEGSDKLSRFGIEEFIVDGVIVLRCGVDVVGGKPRSLLIKKMRRTNHDLNSHSFEITDRGIKIVE